MWCERLRRTTSPLEPTRRRRLPVATVGADDVGIGASDVKARTAMAIAREPIGNWMPLAFGTRPCVPRDTTLEARAGRGSRMACFVAPVAVAVALESLSAHALSSLLVPAVIRGVCRLPKL